MFKIQPYPISLAAPPNECAGAVVTFEGVVRPDRNEEGLEIIALNYQAFDELAESEGNAILDKGIQNFNLLSAEAIHATGSVPVKGVSVIVRVSAKHRSDAFNGCEWIMTEIKQRVPIWKQEVRAAGPGNWLANHESESAPDNRFPEEFPLGATQILNRKRVAVVGVGGLGCSASVQLARQGIGTIILIDADRIEPSNLDRQVLFSKGDIGKPKASVAGQKLLGDHGAENVTVVLDRLDRGNGAKLLKGCDVILDCTDQFSSKYTLNDLAFELGVPLVSASVHRMYAEVQALVPGKTPCLRCLSQSQPNDGCVKSCSEDGVFGPLVSELGVIQAGVAIKLLLGLPEPLTEHLLTIDAVTRSMSLWQRTFSEQCNLCHGTKQAAKPPARSNTIKEMKSPQNTVIEITPGDIVDPGNYVWVDVRESGELVESPQAALIPWHHLPMSSFNPDAYEALQKDRTEPLMIVCEHGVRSLRVANALAQLGFNPVYSLAGGMVHLREHAQPH